jgi:ABC-type Na+ efflux pump permease subunit
MFLKVATFEFSYQRRSPVFWVTAIVLFLLGYFAVVGGVTVGAGGASAHKNSPYALAQIHLILAIFSMFVTTAFVANVIVRDDDTRFGPIVRSTRITKATYLFGRFLGAFAAAALAVAAVTLGLWIGSLMPWLDQETLGPNRVRDYLFAYFVLLLPSIFVTSAVFFALATATRSMLTTYVGAVALLILYTVVILVVTQRPELRHGLSLFEPFGLAAFSESTRYWTLIERNAMVPPLAGALLVNRLIWAAIALVSLAAAYFIYNFSERGSRKKARKGAAAAPAAAPPPPLELASLPRPSGPREAARAQMRARTVFEARQIVRSPAFGVLLVLGLFNVTPGLWLSGALFGTPTLPLTRLLIPILMGGFAFFPTIIAVYYAGEVVWRERDRRTHEIIDATPLPNSAYLIPKTIAVTIVLWSALLVSVVAAVLVQLLKSYYDFRLDEYLLWYVAPLAVDLALTAILAVFFQSIVPNKYAGWGLMVLFLILTLAASQIGLEHHLLLYGEGPKAQFSDLNGAGNWWQGGWWFRLYWGAFALILLVAAHVLWRRGTETRLKPRLARLKPAMKRTPGLLAGIGLAVFVASGAWIYYNTNVLNPYRSSGAADRFAADYEKKYLRFETLPQPSIDRVMLNVALYPKETRAVVHGSYVVKNLTKAPIAEVHVRHDPRSLELLDLSFPGARLVSDDKAFGYRIYRLDKPMAPGEERSLGFTTRRWQRGFRNEGDDYRLVRNGTFLNNFELAPMIGMDRNSLLQDRAKRRKFGLPPELRVAKLEDLSATAKSYFGSGWSTADITISTDGDQVPIAPGVRVLDVVKDGRRTARFVSDAPILTFFSIQSARYAQRHRLYKGIDFGIYYHPAHYWNVDRMLNALQASLDYFQPNFGPYQFSQARIIEFPGYSAFAQAFANTIPYSESIGFAADTTDPDKIDYVTYVTAHELAHQWWAHQIIGSNQQGATMLSETLAQYSALMVMKHLYGEDKIRRFLKFELDQYLRSRGNEKIEEEPLDRVENQQYIHYRKGSLVMYLTQDRLGEDAVNRALRSVLDAHKFKGAPYPRSIELVDALKREAKTPQDLALIADLFERITVWDLKVDEPKAARRADGKWDVTVPVVARKYYVSGKGKETEAPLLDSIPVGLFTAEPGRGAFDRRNVLTMGRQPIHSGRQVFRFVTARKPTHAGVDPYNFYIDRNSDDNLAKVG